MTAISVPISDERLARLKELAEEAHVAPDELLRRAVEEWLNRPKDDFAQAVEYVLRKNAGLYRRLA